MKVKSAFSEELRLIFHPIVKQPFQQAPNWIVSILLDISFLKQPSRFRTGNISKKSPVGHYKHDLGKVGLVRGTQVAGN